MKKIKYIAGMLLVAGSLSSCNNVIDIFPVENNTADQFYSSETEVNQAVMGIYAHLGRNGGNTDFPTDFCWQASEGRSDNLYQATPRNAQRDQVDFRTYSVTDVTSLNENLYGRLYQIVGDANMLLQKAGDNYGRYKAEASFLRALAYFELVRAYGSQPIVDRPLTSEEAKALPREDISKVYDFIISDLNFAAQNLQPFYSGSEAGRVGSVAVKCLLGEVYVTMAGYPLNDKSAYQKAEDTLAPIMSEVKDRFASNFSDIFELANENKYDLFSIQFASGGHGTGSSMAAYVTQGGSALSMPEYFYAGYQLQGQDFRVDTLLVNQMKKNKDKRLEATIIDGFWKTLNHGTSKADSAQYYIKRTLMVKFLGKDNTNTTIKAWNDSPINYPLLRPADAYLLFAEALINNNKADQAKRWIDAIRQRAGLPILDHTPTMPDLMEERRYEFLGEGKRYFDLVRMGKDTFLSTLKAFSDHYEQVTKFEANPPAEKDLLLPIPLSVMNIQKGWVNNPGY